MTRAEFIQWLKDEVTMSGALAVNLPDKEYDRIITKELKTLYDIYSETAVKSFCVLPVQLFHTPEFRKNRYIQFPECVLSVTNLEEMKQRNSMFGINDPDFRFTKAFMSDMWLGGMINMDSVVYRTIQASTYDQLKGFTLVDIRHQWNEVTRQLSIQGHDPSTHVWCELYVKAPEQDLFDDIWVQKWISAHCKLQANKLMTLFTTTLVGGVQINMSAFTEEANKDIEECKAKFIEFAATPHLFKIHS